MPDSGEGGVGQWLIDLVMKPGTSVQLVREKKILWGFVKEGSTLLLL